jgi:trypsin-like peptidase
MRWWLIFVLGGLALPCPEGNCEGPSAPHTVAAVDRTGASAEGLVRSCNYAIPDWSLLSHNRLSLHLVYENGTRYLRLHFVDTKPTGDKPTSYYAIVVLNGQGDEVLRYAQKQFEQADELWTDIIIGDRASVVIETADAIPNLRFRIKEYAFWRPLPQVKTLVQNKLEPIGKYLSNVAITATAKSVALINFIDGRGNTMYTCTGFMISDDMMITNDHCIDSDSTCRSAKIIFNYLGDYASAERHECVSVKRHSPTEDWSIVQVDGSPGNSTKWGHLKLVGRDLDRGDFSPSGLFIVQHPGFQTKQVSVQGCALTSTSAPNEVLRKIDFADSCDAVDGTSGSPVSDATGAVVGIHHLGAAAGWERQNRAIRVNAIYEEIKDLLPSS